MGLGYATTLAAGAAMWSYWSSLGSRRSLRQAQGRLFDRASPELAEGLRTSEAVDDLPSVATARRTFLLGLCGTAAAYGTALWAGRGGGVRTSDLPLAVLDPTPTAPTPTSSAVSAAPPTPASSPTVEPLPVPPPARKLTRDKDGSLIPSGRPNGTLSPPITSNDHFYVVTKNAVADPVVDPATWRLVVDGEVMRPVQLDYRTLRSLPSVEVTKTLERSSNFTAMCELTSFGSDLMSTARWKGVRVRDVIALAGGLKPGALGLAVLSVDEFSAGLPIEAAMDLETLVVFEMNGQVLPREHGYPARLLARDATG